MLHAHSLRIPQRIQKIFSTYLGSVSIGYAADQLIYLLFRSSSISPPMSYSLEREIQSPSGAVRPHRGLYPIRGSP